MQTCSSLCAPCQQFGLRTEYSFESGLQESTCHVGKKVRRKIISKGNVILATGRAFYAAGRACDVLKVSEVKLRREGFFGIQLRSCSFP